MYAPRLVDRLPVTGDILRGSLLQRTIRNHAKSCAKCASGEGHQLAVLTVSYAGGKTRQVRTRVRAPRLTVSPHRVISGLRLRGYCCAAASEKLP
jgi:hypothetical protein